MGKRLLPEQIQKIIKLYKKGYQLSEISRRLKIHRQTVSKYVKMYTSKGLAGLYQNMSEDDKSKYTIDKYSVLFEVLGRNIDEDLLEDYEKIREFIIYDEKDAEMLKKCGFEVEEKKSKFGRYFIVKIPLGLVHLIAHISFENFAELFPIDTVEYIAEKAEEIGDYKMKNCEYNENGFCMVWYYKDKPSFGKEGEDYIMKAGKYFSKANKFMCAVCPYFRKKWIIKEK